jgi:hypothetical protein
LVLVVHGVQGDGWSWIECIVFGIIIIIILVVVRGVEGDGWSWIDFIACGICEGGPRQLVVRRQFGRRCRFLQTMLGA